eukprot:gene2001-1508_t
MKSSRRPNKVQTSLGESIYLFVWALLKSSKEVFIDFAYDILDSLSSTQRKNKRLKSTKLYWTKLQRQMGILEENKSEKSQKTEDEPGENKLESLENEIMNLKLELESFTSPRGTKTNLLEINNKIEKGPMPKGPVPKGPPLPPPPPPNSARSSYVAPTKKETPKPIEKKQETKPTHNRSESVTTDALQQAAKLLRKTKPKSPAPSPKKAPQMCFQNDLFNAIKSKFKKVIDEDDDKDAWSGYNSPQRKSSFSSSPKPKELVASQNETSKAIENTQNFLNFEDLESLKLQNKI